MMKSAIFYSWQSDLPNNTNRGFIQRALEIAVKELAQDESLQIEAVIDRDTMGRPGAPPIAETIFRKIENAALFVADVSIIHSLPSTKPKHVPNPNVCIELGYAIAKLGSERVILVQNAFYGGPELLPFDLKFRRALVYTARPDESNRAEERAQLVRQLKEALKPIFELLQQEQPIPLEESAIDKLVSTLEHGATGQGARARDAMRSLVIELDALAPDLSKTEGGSKEDLMVVALGESKVVISKFGRIVANIIDHGSEEAFLAMVKAFGVLIDRYEAQTYGRSEMLEFELYRVVGYEMLVILTSSLLLDEKWDWLKKAFELRIPCNNRLRDTAKRYYRFNEVRSVLKIFETLQERSQSRWISPVGAFFKERYTSEPPYDLTILDLAEADFFLYFCDFVRGKKDSDWSRRWFPYVSLYLFHNPPRWLTESRNKAYAEGLCHALGIDSIEELITFLEDLKQNAQLLFKGPLNEFLPFHGVELTSVGSQ